MPYRHKKRCPKATVLVALRATIDVEPHRAAKNAPIRRLDRGRVTAPFDHNAGGRALARDAEHFAELASSISSAKVASACILKAGKAPLG